MRVGLNPQRGKAHSDDQYIHHVVIPVYIPNDEGFYADVFRIFRLCMKSLLGTCHDATFITIVNNGCHREAIDYIDGLFRDGKIHEVIHSTNIGKVNAIIKGVSGHSIELVTIADADVMFLPGWQKATTDLFAAFPKAGVVGLVPQYKTFTFKCDNLLFDNFFSRRLKFVKVKNPASLEKYYDSIGWDENRNPHYQQLALGIENKGRTAYVGAGHVAATYKRNVFSDVRTFFNFKLGGNTLRYIDSLCLDRDYWRLTTYDNYAYHMGNVHEDWMDAQAFFKQDVGEVQSDFPVSKRIGWLPYVVKNKIFAAFFRNYKVRRWFYRFKKLPRHMIQKY